MRRGILKIIDTLFGMIVLVRIMVLSIPLGIINYVLTEIRYWRNIKRKSKQTKILLFGLSVMFMLITSQTAQAAILSQNTFSTEFTSTHFEMTKGATAAQADDNLSIVNNKLQIAIRDANSYDEVGAVTNYNITDAQLAGGIWINFTFNAVYGSNVGYQVLTITNTTPDGSANCHGVPDSVAIHMNSGGGQIYNRVGGSQTQKDADAGFQSGVDKKVAWFINTTTSILLINGSETANFVPPTFTNNHLKVCFATSEIAVHNGTVYIYDFSMQDSSAPPINPPVLSNLNCTSCVADATPNVAPYTTTDISPTFTLTTDINADCKIGDTNVNKSTMNANYTCSGDGSTSHTCTVNESEWRVTDIVQKIYIACAATSGGYENVTSSTPAGLEMDEWSLGIVLSNNMTVYNSSNPVTLGDLNFTSTDYGTFTILTDFTIDSWYMELTGGKVYKPDGYELYIKD